MTKPDFILNNIFMPILTDSKKFIQNEFSNLNLGDKRLNRRALEVAASINAGPSFSIPAMTNGKDGDLKAIYRFFQNDKVDDQKLLHTHYLNTIERMEAYNGKILLLNDSCFVTPTKNCEGLLTRGKGKDNCVRTHYCLATSEDGKHIFGILNYHALTDPISERYPDLRDESDIWILTAENCIALILSSSQGSKLLSRCLFTADREGDEFELIHFLIENKLGFIIRSQYNRHGVYGNEEIKLDDIEFKSKNHGEAYTVKTRVGKEVEEVKVKRSVLRNITIMPPHKNKKEFAPIELNIVLVKDVETDGEKVKWRLHTSEEIENSSSSQFVVSSYANRWKIEEVNKGAKTGVRVEERQFTDLDHFLPFLAMAFVVAWRIVALRTVVEVAPETPVKKAFTSDEVAYMKVQAKEFDLPMKNVKDGLFLIARLGGFTSRYERPGWQILWQGWIKFYERVAGFTLARKSYSK
jgi:hypothetical protein